MFKPLLTLFFIICSFCAMCQKGSVVSVGVSKFLFNKNKNFTINSLNTNGIYFAYEAIPLEYTSGKFQYTRSFGDDTQSYWDFRMSIAYLLKIKDKKNPRKGSRLSFPLHLSFFFWNLTNNPGNQYGYLGYGGQLGVRYYLTYKIALEGFYGLNRSFINKINDKQFKDSIGFISSNQITIGVSYFITK